MSQSEEKRSPLDTVLNLVTEVRAGEGVTALLLTINIFLLLSAYYLIKPVREELILVLEGGARYKSYMSAAIAVALLFAVPVYSNFAKRLPRNRLVIGVTLFFISHIALFFFAAQVPAIKPNLGLIFYLWVGIFNMMVVAQFWAFANDLYTEEQGKRLFALIGVGASTGAVVGAWVAGILRKQIDVFLMLLIAAGLLGLCAFLVQVAHVRESGKKAETPPAPPKDEKKKQGGAFGMVFKYRYLTLLAAFSLIFTLVNTNGEFMLGELAAGKAYKEAKAELTKEKIQAFLAKPTSKGEIKKEFDEKKASDFKGMTLAQAKPKIAKKLTIKGMAGKKIGIFFSDFFFWVNLVGVLLQMFVVSRLVKYAGLKWSFFIFPVIALLDASAVAILPALAVLRIGKTAENATDYSLNNTLRNMLWLPTTKQMKYQAKQAVDTFFVRMGDVSSAVLVFFGAGMLGWEIRGFAITNLVLVAIWLFVAAAIIREQGVLKKMRESGEIPDEEA